MNNTNGEPLAISVQELNTEMVNNVLPVTIFIGSQAFVGFLGNCLILFVYARSYPHCNFRYLVLCLAIYDLTSCLTTLPGEVYTHFNWYTYRYDWMCKIKSYFNVFTAWGSAYTLLILAFDRCRKICRPLGRQIQPSLTLKLCAGGLSLSATVSIPILFLWGQQTYTYEMDHLRLNVSVCEKSGLYANDNYPFIYISSVYLGPVGAMMVAICICNILLARTLMCRLFQRRGRNTTGTNIHYPNKVKSVTFELSKTSSFASLATVTESVSETENQNTTASSSNDMVTVISQGKSKTNGITTCLCQSINQDQCSIRKSTTFLSPAMQIEKDRRSSSNSSNVNRPRDRSIRSNSDEDIHRQKRKTFIMLTLTSVYIVTMTLYICLVSLVAEKDGILKKLSNNEKVAFIFFLRLYFINSVINPILYGIMDPRFRAGMKRMFLPYLTVGFTSQTQ